MKLLLRWVVSAAAVAVAVYLLEGIRLEGGAAAFFGVALILGLVNALIRPILSALSCGLVFLTLGLFLLVINAIIILFTDTLIGGFEVSGFWIALLFSLLLSLFQSILFSFLDKD